MRSAGLRAPSSAARAFAISPKTVCSWAAMPLTVSTRFGMRSARRCKTTSTSAQVAFTVSDLRTISFRRPTYDAPISTARNTSAPRTASSLLIFPPAYTLARATSHPLLKLDAARRAQAPVHFFHDARDDLEKSREERPDGHLLLSALALPHIEDSVEGSHVNPEQLPQAIHHVALSLRLRFAQDDQSVPEKRDEGRKGRGHQPEQRFRVLRGHEISLAKPDQTRPHFAFDLDSMQAHRHVEPVIDVFSEKHLPAGLDVP